MSDEDEPSLREQANELAEEMAKNVDGPAEREGLAEPDDDE